MVRDFHACIAADSEKPAEVYTGYVKQEIPGKIASIPVGGLDEEAVKAINLVLNVTAETH